ncbi:MAG: ABC transporter permease, partial [Candidatus Poseidoniales archaeon]
MKLQEFIVRRLILLIPVIWGVSVFTFAIAQVIPADPAAALCGEKCGVMGSNGLTAYESNVIRLGLDKPIVEQYWIYVTNLLQGDWGES